MSETYMIDSKPKSQTATVNELGLCDFSFEPIQYSYSTPKAILIEVSSTQIRHTIELMGIPFAVRYGEENVFLESAQWPSLQTFGKSTHEAIQNMMSLLKDVIEEFVFASDSELAEDAIEFKQYLVKKTIS